MENNCTDKSRSVIILKKKQWQRRSNYGQATVYDFRCCSTCNVESHVLRYWEEELELTVPRNEMGHRYYTKENIEQFMKIKEWKEQGYQLKAIAFNT